MKNFIFEFLKQLVTHKINFVICGGIACILQGCERTTLDLDINVNLTEKNIEKLITLLKKEKFITRIPEPIENFKYKENREKWIKDKNALVYTVFSKDSLLQVDIFLYYPIDFKTLKNNSNIIEIDKIKFHISSKEDLIKAKKLITPLRLKDKDDINTLERLLNDKK
jgi:hypothetical protein